MLLEDLDDVIAPLRALTNQTDTEAKLQDDLLHERITTDQYEARIDWLVHHAPDRLLAPPFPVEPVRPAPDALVSAKRPRVAKHRGTGRVLLNMACVYLGIAGILWQMVFVKDLYPAAITLFVFLACLPAFLRGNPVIEAAVKAKHDRQLDQEFRVAETPNVGSLPFRVGGLPPAHSPIHYCEDCGCIHVEDDPLCSRPSYYRRLAAARVPPKKFCTICGTKGHTADDAHNL